MLFPRPPGHVYHFLRNYHGLRMRQFQIEETIHSFSFTWNSFIDLLWNHFFFVMSLHVKKKCGRCRPEKGIMDVGWFSPSNFFEMLRLGNPSKQKHKDSSLLVLNWAVSIAWCLWISSSNYCIQSCTTIIQLPFANWLQYFLRVAQLPSIQKQVVAGHDRLSTFDSHYPPWNEHSPWTWIEHVLLGFCLFSRANWLFLSGGGVFHTYAKQSDIVSLLNPIVSMYVWYIYLHLP